LTDRDISDKNLKIMEFNYELLMKEALKEAKKGREIGEVPIGAILAGPDGKILAKAHNRPVSRRDPTAHAEILALRSAGASIKNYRLKDTILVVTLEPCIMCMGAAINARISRLVFGAFDPKSGAACSLYNLAADSRLNHRIEVISGILEQECSDLLKDFFHTRRTENNLSRRGTEVVVTGSTRNRLVPLIAGHVGSNPTLSAKP
jgi:tRNA(adenine34) deaminase